MRHPESSELKTLEEFSRRRARPMRGEGHRSARAFGLRAKALAALVVGVWLGGVVGCEGSPKEPSAYDYILQFGYKEGYNLRSGATLYLDGEEVGREGRKFTLPRDKALTGGVLTVRRETSCGAESRRIVLPPEYTAEWEVGERLKIAQDLARSEELNLSPPSSSLHLFGLHAAERLKERGDAVLYVDNRDRSEPVVVTLGKTREEIKAGVHYSLAAEIGSCSEALDVTVDGKKLGTLDEARPHGLIDVSGDHCYAVRTAFYGRIGAAVPKGRSKMLEKAPGQRLVPLWKMDWFLVDGPSPRSVKGDVSGRSRHDTLQARVCPQARGAAE